MGRPKNLISYPRLNDHSGDVKRTWYVEYAFRVPGYEDEFRRRVYTGLGSGTAEERYANAARIIEQVTAYLKSGEYLKHDVNYDPVRSGDEYRPEVGLYRRVEKEHQVRHLIGEFIKTKASSLRKSSLDTYMGELVIFRDWVEEKLDNPHVRNITRPQLIRFFSYLAADKSDGGRGLCRKTISKYESNLHGLFEYCIDMELIEQNPVERIPKYGKIIDCSSDIYTKDEMQRLKNAILPRQPYLWLAIELLYYCAIRPGTEIRLLRVKHIHRERKVIEIPAEMAKNKKTQYVRVPDQVLELMERLSVFGYDGEMYIFGHTGVPGVQPLGVSTMRNRFAEYRRELGISKDKKFYGWKHTGAISAADNGADIYELKDHMRHSSIATTEKYLRKRSAKIGAAEKYIDRI